MATAFLSPSAPSARRSRPALMVQVVPDENRCTVVALRGEADVSTRFVLADVLSRVIASRSADVVIDLGEADFIDTATVRTFAVCRQLLDRRGRRLTFRSPSRLATRVLDLFGMTDLIEFPARVSPLLE